MSNNWLTCLRPNPQAKLCLFCFPHAGAGTAAFRLWPGLLPQFEVCAVKLPGRESRFRESLFVRLSPLIDELIPALFSYLDRPFAFFGHSFGALVSFELARQLRQQNHPLPLHLFISGHRAPQLPNPRASIYNLPDSEFINELRRFNGTSESILQNQDYLKFYLSILRADLAMDETYVYVPNAPLAASITAFGGWQDPKASREELAAWQNQTSGDFCLHMLPGDHFFINQEREELLKLISHQLSALSLI